MERNCVLCILICIIVCISVCIAVYLCILFHICGPAWSVPTSNQTQVQMFSPVWQWLFRGLETSCVRPQNSERQVDWIFVFCQLIAHRSHIPPGYYSGQPIWMELYDICRESSDMLCTVQCIQFWIHTVASAKEERWRSGQLLIVLYDCENCCRLKVTTWPLYVRCVLSLALSDQNVDRQCVCPYSLFSLWLSAASTIPVSHSGRWTFHSLDFGRSFHHSNVGCVQRGYDHIKC